MPLEQLAERQETVGKAQAVRFEPSHDPPQTVPSEAHDVRAPRGAPEAGEHVPSSPATLQASHWLGHRLLQHTPSTQYPARH
jgi:hypothetical protein